MSEECKQHHWPNEEGKCPYCEIERLEDENAQLKQGYTAVRNDMSRVSKAVVEKDKRIIAIWKEHGYKITTKQIRAAWKYATTGNNCCGYVEVALGKLGIERCEGCGGSRMTGPARPSVKGDGSFVRNKCPDCNGEGFKIGGEDE